MMNIGILSTGNELLRGVIADTNGAWLAARLDELGFTVDRLTSVGDNLDALSNAISEYLNTFDLTIIGGGLGPTDDDLTALAAARAVGCKITRHQDAVLQVKASFERMDRPMAEVNLKQADLPETANVLKNRLGTAPGFELSNKKGTALFFPGVPMEFKDMVERYVVPKLQQNAPRLQRSVLKCFGTGESNVQTELQPVIDAFPAIDWAYRASFPEIGITLTSEDGGQLAAALEQAKQALVPFVFAEEETNLPQVLVRTTLERGFSLATAESCTGGLVGHSITETPGASGCFRGGVIAYDNSVKSNVLGVSPTLLAEHGAVSEPVVRAMASGIKSRMECDFGLAVSGIAGPTGGSIEKPVGLVHMAVAGPDEVLHRVYNFKGMNRSSVKQVSAWTLMWMMLTTLQETR